MEEDRTGVWGTEVDMDGRTRLAIGGIATVAASVAVICTVALTNSAALSHADAVAIRAAKIVVPAGKATAPDRPAQTTEPAPAPTDDTAPADPADTAPAPEIVPAPAPVVVAPSVSAPSSSAPTPEQPTDPGAKAVADAVRAGAWDTIREWAVGWGWSAERIDAWIAKLQRLRDAAAGPVPPVGDDQRQVVSPDGNRVSGPDAAVQVQGKDKDRSRWTEPGRKRPAEAGANAGSRPLWPRDGAKKDRSQVPPDLVDR
ncbi:hypothetical protein ACFUTX_04450 [Microbacterium sp. NPDC057407]|uniref:hypothetical protein n=1 Tax=Microbacterium sp. NPDC057407 TaxID=3346120 RepID=UPI0036700656